MKITEVVKTWSGHVEIPGTLKGQTVCTATHPDKPNFSGHSRGRKLHLLKTKDKTFCNMLVDQLAPNDYRYYSMTHNGVCKSCLNAIKK